MCEETSKGADSSSVFLGSSWFSELWAHSLMLSFVDRVTKPQRVRYSVLPVLRNPVCVVSHSQQQPCGGDPAISLPVWRALSRPWCAAASVQPSNGIPLGWFVDRAYLELEITLSQEQIQKYTDCLQLYVNSTLKELRRLFLVQDLVDSLKVWLLLLLALQSPQRKNTIGSYNSEPTKQALISLESESLQLCGAVKLIQAGPLISQMTKLWLRNILIFTGVTQ